MRWLHILCGLTAIVSGAIAFLSVKGGSLHRRIGMVFVVSMLAMTLSAIFLALAHQPGPGNIVAATLTLYMVVTALLTVRRPQKYGRQFDVVTILLITLLGFVAIGLGLFRRDAPETPGGYPPPAYFILALGCFAMAAQDFRRLTTRPLQGPARLKRHLSRMGGAMFVATGSFFLGQPQVFRGGPLEAIQFRAIPVVAIVIALIYWRRRVTREPMRIVV